MDKAREGTPPEWKQPGRGALLSEKLGKALLVTAGSRRESWLRAALGSALPSRSNDRSGLRHKPLGGLCLLCEAGLSKGRYVNPFRSLH